jgi:hypothetical protein
MRTLILAVAFVSLAGAQARPGPAFDPAGKWTYSTVDAGGSAVSGTMEVTGKPGAYKGTIMGGGDTVMQITDVFTSANGAVFFTNLPDGTPAVIKLTEDASGKIQSTWGPLAAVIPATLARTK